MAAGEASGLEGMNISRKGGDRGRMMVKKKGMEGLE